MSDIIASTYEILENIGSGGGGVVYLANHIRLDKRVVLKVDKRKITTKPELLRREVDSLKNLSHTFIPQVYDFFVEDDSVYTVMDYIEGESLDKPLKRGETFSQPQVIKWAKQLLDALCYLHNPIHGTPPRGIVHSDIKPANIMRTPHGDICLIDFNIALALGEENVVGRSAGYASPEHYGLDFSTNSPYTSSEANTETLPLETEDATVAMENLSSSSSTKKVIPDVRSDIYSLGATLYHLLSGRRPERNAYDVKPLSDKEFSQTVVHIISKAMNPNPDLRYQTAEEMLYDFEHLRENDPRTKRRKRICAVVSSVLGVAIAAGAFSSFTGLKRMESTQKSLTLAEYSQNALNDGDPVLAVDYALEALPVKNNIFTPDYTSQAKKALTDALGVYDLSNGYKSHHMLKLPSETLKTALSPDGKTGVAIYAFAAVIFDTETGETIAELPLIKSALADVVFIDNNTLAYAGENGLSVYDIENKTNVWTGKSATHIAVSADKGTIAGIYRDEGFATVYNADGTEKATVSFGGNKQRVVENDTFADPKDNLFVLNSNGQYLAASFANGALTIFDVTNSENNIEIYDESEFTHFEGGFSGEHFAFSSTTDGSSVFAVISMTKLEQEGGFELDSRIGVNADETGIYLSHKSTVVKIDPITGEQEEVAYADSDVRMFETDTKNTILGTEKNDYIFYDKSADLISRFNGGQVDCSIVNIAGDYALVAGIDSPNVRIIKQSQHNNSDLFSYDESYQHDEARISGDGEAIMLFDFKSFRLYKKDGTLIKEVTLPEADKIYDQQYSKKSGNLAVMYNTAFRLYSGKTGDAIYEKTGLKSVFYAPYGVSVLDSDNNLHLIDIDTGEEILSEKAQGDYAAYCGMTVDSEFLGDGELIGASKRENGYLFAVKYGEICSVYDNDGNKKFEIPVLDQSEAFFTDKTVVLSPLHGTPSAYNLSDGSKRKDLEKDSYLTYITQLEKYIMSEYVSADGERYGVLLDKDSFEPLASLPWLTDISEDEVIFDYHKGKLRKTRIYSIDELLEYAKGGGEF